MSVSPVFFRPTPQFGSAQWIEGKFGVAEAGDDSVSFSQWYILNNHGCMMAGGVGHQRSKGKVFLRNPELLTIEGKTEYSARK